MDNIIAQEKPVSLGQIALLEDFINTLPQVEFPVHESFVNGLYCRTIFVPFGNIIVSATHKEDSFLFVRQGTSKIWDVEKTIVVTTGAMLPTKAGTKRVGYAFTDCVFSSVHSNAENITDKECLWKSLTIPEDSSIKEQLIEELLK